MISGPSSSLRSDLDHGPGVQIDTIVEIEYDSRKELGRSGV
jgi:hypothetical protein